jgi:hypothetical protein
MRLVRFPSRHGFALAASLATGCVPNLDTDESSVTAPRVLAVVTEPAEARPGASVRYSALLVDQDGPREQGALAWFYCLAQKPLAELGPVDPVCLQAGARQLSRIGRGAEVQGAIPPNACALFGPNIPQPEEGQEPGRPVDPDDTGGFKQPVVLGLNVGQGDQLILFEQRISCDLPGVSAQLAAQYRQRYHANENPQIRDVLVQRGDGSEQRLGPGERLDVERSEELTLRVRWSGCPESDSCGDTVCGPDETRESCSEDCAAPVGCTGQERYLWFDTAKRDLVVRRESMRLAWYATGGSYREERTGQDEDDGSNVNRNHWTAPKGAGDATLWVVARDARGGVGTFELPVKVR